MQNFINIGPTIFESYVLECDNCGQSAASYKDTLISLLIHLSFPNKFEKVNNKYGCVCCCGKMKVVNA